MAETAAQAPFPTPPSTVVQAILGVLNDASVKFDPSVVSGPVQAATLAAQAVMSALATADVTPDNMKAVEERVEEALKSLGVEREFEPAPIAEGILAAAYYAPGGVWTAAFPPDWTTTTVQRCPRCGTVAPGNVMIDHIKEVHGEAAANEEAAARETAVRETGLLARAATLEPGTMVKVFEASGRWNVSIAWETEGEPHEALGASTDLGTAIDAALAAAGR